MSYDLLRADIAARRDGLSPRLRQIADFALRNPSDMALETVAVIAQRAGVPPSSLIRFANALGYEGFSAMQRVFRSRLVQRSQDYAERIETLSRSGEGATSAAILDRLAESGVQALERLRATLPPERLERAVDLLAGADLVHVVGQRRAYPVAVYLGYALAQLGVRGHVLDGAGGMLLNQAALLGPGDVLVAVSFAPYAPETLAMAGRADEAGMPIVAITDGPPSPLAPLARVSLDVEDAELREFRSLSATMCLVLALVVRLGQRLTVANGRRRPRRAQRGGKPPAAPVRA